MKLFKIELRIKRKHGDRNGVDTVVHARSRAAAEKYLGGKCVGSQIVSVIDLGTASKHFVIADLVD
jgi:hypothetical protein